MNVGTVITTSDTANPPLVLGVLAVVSFFGSEEERLVSQETKNPGLGFAILSLVLGLFFPVLPGLASLYVALATKQPAAKIVAYLGIVVSIIWLLFIVLAGFGMLN